jgi:hypothetical protein
MKWANCEDTLKATWPITNSLTKRGTPKASSVIHGPLGIMFYPIDQANVMADCSE